MSAVNQFESTNLAVEFFEVEMSNPNEQVGCSSCDDARERLAKAVALTRPVLATVGIVPEIVSRRVTTEREARLRRVAASPTIRIGGEEIRPVHRDNTEEGRVWSWQGEDHTQPPVGMLVDLLLRGYAATRVKSLASTDIAPYVTQFLRRAESQTRPPEAPCGCR